MWAALHEWGWCPLLLAAGMLLPGLMAIGVIR